MESQNLDLNRDPAATSSKYFGIGNKAKWPACEPILKQNDDLKASSWRKLVDLLLYNTVSLILRYVLSLLVIMLPKYTKWPYRKQPLYVVGALGSHVRIVEFHGYNLNYSWADLSQETGTDLARV